MGRSRAIQLTAAVLITARLTGVMSTLTEPVKQPAGSVQPRTGRHVIDTAKGRFGT
jgi:hypothetical protein